MKNNLILTGISITSAIFIFLLAKPVFAQIVTNSVQSVAKNIEVGSEDVDEFQQVFMVIDGNKKFLTEKRENSFDPVTDGSYVVWVTQINGAGQIFRYDISSGQILQITSSSTNLNARVSGGKVVWERWIGDKWQIFLFDGVTTRQLTEGDVSFNPDIEGNNIVFARQSSKGELRAVKYIIGGSQTEDIGIGFDKRYPYFIDSGQIEFGVERQKETNFPPRSQNIINKTPSTPQPITEKDVKNELTPTALGEITASNSAVSVPVVSTNSATLTSPSPAHTPVSEASSSATPSSAPSATPIASSSATATSSAK